ncbi:ketopantoate reductase family protein [Vibrio sp. MA40-2]|uniref:ketopantoate reductase family protein n=1 Tax=Vibrio sp. MA40-2 TaxID=3391828 RepID=UPI0039A62478
MNNQQPILIWGAGAIGGVLAAYLARAGKEVHVVDIVEEHVEKINAQGLDIQGPVDAFNQPLKAFLPSQLTQQYDCIILAVKAHHTDGAVDMLTPFLSENGFVVSAQNGLNEHVIAKKIGAEKTVGCFVNFGADWLEPGVILYGNRAAIAIGELDGSISQRATDVHALFSILEPDSVLTDNIWGYLWGKLGYGSLLICTALTPDSMSDAMAKEAHYEAYASLGHEVMVLAKALGIKPMSFNGFECDAFLSKDPIAVQQSLDMMVAHNRKTAKTHSGIWRDLAIRKRKTEVDAQIQSVIDQGERLNIETPALTSLVSLINAIENGHREQKSELVDELILTLNR